jgi:hypothetical protein
MIQQFFTELEEYDRDLFENDLVVVEGIIKIGWM